MKIAIIHDSFTALGGAEKVVAVLAGALKAPVLTAGVAPSVLEYLEARRIKVFDLGAPPSRGPSVVRHSRLIRAFGNCRLVGGPFDAYVLSGTFALFAARRHHPNLLYCHTPARALYDLNRVVLERQRNPAKRAASATWLSWWRRLDRRAVAWVDRIIANGANTQERIRRYWGRESRIIHPPVEVDRLKFNKSGDFWLSVNRLTPEKRVALQVEAFAKLPDQKLVVVGGGWSRTGDERLIRELSCRAGNVEFLGAVPQAHLDQLYADCKGLIATAQDEDFGLTPVEAMAAGKPVVATDEGGYRESVTAQTGILVPARVDALVEAIRSVAADPLRYRDSCQRRARAFSADVFLSQMIQELEELKEKTSNRR